MEGSGCSGTVHGAGSGADVANGETVISGAYGDNGEIDKNAHVVEGISWSSSPHLKIIPS